MPPRVISTHLGVGGDCVYAPDPANLLPNVRCSEANARSIRARRAGSLPAKVVAARLIRFTVSFRA
jgi:hypothetical protein